MTKTRDWFLPLFMIIFFLAPSEFLKGQEELSPSVLFPAGINAGFGLGNLALKDKYISDEKYTGITNQIYFGWARVHDKYAYRLKFCYGFSDEIKNNNARTEISIVRLNQGFLYPLSPQSLFSKAFNLFIGPSTEFIFYDNEPHIAVSGFDYSRSIAALLSVGINAEAFFSLSQKFQVESTFGLSVLSFAFRMVDDEEDDQSPAKLVTPFRGFDSSFDLGIRYIVIQSLSLAANYEFQLMSVSAWDPLIFANDLIKLSLTFNF